MKTHCPLCNSTSISNEGSGSTQGSIEHYVLHIEANVLKGKQHRYYYCPNCFTYFDILISYTQYPTPRPKKSGNTGMH